MTSRFILAIMALSAMTTSCHKKQTESASVEIQHKWQIVSLNGEALRYVGQSGDYFDFNNGILIESYAGHGDTLSYSLANNGTTLDLQSGAGSLDLQIITLNDHQLILDGTASLPTIRILDSLSR